MDDDDRRLLSGARWAANQRRKNLDLSSPLSPMSYQSHAKPGTTDINRVFFSLEFRGFLGNFGLLRLSAFDDKTAESSSEIKFFPDDRCMPHH
ncbi:uncharacterized protein N7459_007040 [Penicillium hispanicum]|uniref:uncharacterized protein n=1 Tax=Penicillium hispanicum TaxID=1080232 RepID=UPI0025418445|nr:uncharacterized protein N7459_007040 [Penicillium hispanicum]KAJ5578076.1 hypothetical protein N7459_007040 [Penicillium hispanicum]